jgi:hypothetical protein
MTLLVAVAASAAAAQRPAPTTIETAIPVRKLGPTVRASAITFGGVQHVRRLSDGRLLVNDPSRRQVLLLDSTLANPVVVIDSAGGRDNSYGMRAGGIIPYRGDSTFFVDPTSSTLLLIDPAGKIARVMSMPTSAVSYLSSPTSYGYPGYSETFGIVFRVPSAGFRHPPQPPEGAPEIVVKYEDSVAAVGMKVATRKLDTLARISTGYAQVMRVSYNNVNVNSVNDLYPVPDDMVMIADGSIALLSGREYRLRFINLDGTRSDGPRIPFAWRHNSDDEKARIADSINTAREKMYQDRVEAQKKAAEARAKAGAAPPGGRGGPPVEFRPPSSPPPPPTRPPRVEPNEIPDYFPAYERSSGSMRADADTNVWIRPRPAKPVGGGPIYDVLNRKGELVDRVQLPAGRTLIGFGPGGIVYLLARDAGAVRVELARFK